MRIARVGARFTVRRVDVALSNAKRAVVGGVVQGRERWRPSVCGGFEKMGRRTVRVGVGRWRSSRAAEAVWRGVWREWRGRGSAVKRKAERKG